MNKFIFKKVFINLIFLFFSLKAYCLFNGIPKEEFNEFKEFDDSIIFKFSEVSHLNGKNDADNCSAIMINEFQFLTAAHCTEQAILSKRIISLFKNNQTGKQFKLNMSLDNIRHHPKYRLGFKDNPQFNEVPFDICLVTLKKSIFEKIDFKFKFINLNFDFNSSVSDDSNLAVIANGRSQTSSSANDRITNLLVPFGLIKNQTHSTSNNNILTIKSLKFQSGTCVGDSGGPLIQAIQTSSGFDYSLVGIVSTKKNIAKYPCGHPDDEAFVVPLGNISSFTENIYK